MALTNCAECNAQISDQAPACIKCGAPVKTTGSIAGSKSQIAPYLAGAVGVCAIGLAIAFSFHKLPWGSKAGSVSDAANINPDIVALNTLVREICTVEVAEKKLGNQFSDDFMDMGASDVSAQRKQELLADLNKVAASLEAVKNDALKIKAPQLQNAAAGDLAGKGLEAFQARVTAYQQRTQAIIKQDNAEVQRLSQAEADASGKQIAALKNASFAVGSNLHDILNPPGKILPMAAIDPDVVTMKPVYVHMYDIRMKMATVTTQLGRDMVETALPGHQNANKNELLADIDKQNQAMQELCNEAASIKPPVLEDKRSQALAATIVEYFQKWMDASRSRMAAGAKGDPDTVIRMNKATEEAEAQQQSASDTLNSRLGVTMEQMLITH